MAVASGALLAAAVAAGCGTGPSASERANSLARGAYSKPVSSPREASGDAARRSPDAADREAFRDWFVLLADAQFYRTTSDVTDCAALVRHAAREALRPHTAEWLRRMRLPITRVYSEVVNRPVARDGMLPIFRVAEGADERHVEFADARAIVHDNADRVSRDTAALRAGDLLVFHQPQQTEPYHVMVFVGRSVFEPAGDDWVVYHTGQPSQTEVAANGLDEERAGEVRKVRLGDLERHPAPRWRPLAINPRFLGVSRLRLP